MGKSENIVEKKLCDIAESYGAVVRKVVYQGRTNAPDRWCFFPNGGLLVVECKAPGQKPKRAQLLEMQTLRKQGFHVAWVSSEHEAAGLCVSFLARWLDVEDFNKEWPL